MTVTADRPLSTGDIARWLAALGTFPVTRSSRTVDRGFPVGHRYVEAFWLPFLFPAPITDSGTPAPEDCHRAELLQPTPADVTARDRCPASPPRRQSGDSNASEGHLPAWVGRLVGDGKGLRVRTNLVECRRDLVGA